MARDRYDPPYVPGDAWDILEGIRGSTAYYTVWAFEPERAAWAYLRWSKPYRVEWIEHELRARHAFRDWKERQAKAAWTPEREAEAWRAYHERMTRMTEEAKTYLQQQKQEHNHV